MADQLSVNDFPEGFFSDVPQSGSLKDYPSNFFVDAPQENTPESLYLEQTGEVVDLPPGGISRIGAIISNSYSRSNSGVELAELSAQRLFGDDSPELLARIEALRTETNFDIPTDGAFEFILRSTTEQVPVLREIAEKAIIRGGQGAAIGAGVAAIAGQLGPQVALPEEVVTVPGAAILAGRTGARIGLLEEAFILEGGAAFDEFSQFTDVDGNPIDPRAARIGAVIAGSVSAGLELIPVNLLFKMVPGSKKALTKLGLSGKNGVEVPKSPAAMRNFIVNLSSMIAAEGVTEGVQEGVTISVGETLKEFASGEFESVTTDEIISRITEAAKTGAAAGAGLGLTVGGAKAVVETASVGKKGEGPAPESGEKEPEKKDAQGEASTEFTRRVTEIEQKRQQLSEAGKSPQEIDAEIDKLQQEALQKFRERVTRASERDAIDDKVIQGRVQKLDGDILNIDREIDDVQEQLLLREGEGKPIKALENRVDRLITKRDSLDEQRAQLLTAETTTAKEVAAEQAESQTVELKGRALRNQQSKTLLAQERALQSGLREGRKLAKTEVKQAQKSLTELINKSDLNANDKAKFLNTISNVQTAEQLQRAVPRIQSRIANLFEKQQVREQTKRLNRALKPKKIKPKMQSGKAVGKFTPEIQEQLTALSELNGMTKDVATAELEKRLEAGTVDPLANALLAIKSSAIETSSSDIFDLANSVEALAEEGRFIGAAKQLKKKERAIGLRNEFVELMGERDKSKPISKQMREQAGRDFISKGFLSWNGAWWNKLKTIIRSSDLARTEAFVSDVSLFNEARAYENGKTDMVNSFNAKFAEAVGLENTPKNQRKILRRINKDQTEQLDLGTFTHSDGKRRRIIMTRAEARKRWMELQDPQLREVLTNEKGNKYTEEIISAIQNELTDEDVRIAQAQLDFYKDYYNRINKVYRERHGINLPKVEFYSPIKREFASEDTDEFLKGILYRGGVAPGSLKSRQPNIRPILPMGDTEVLISHIMEMEYFIAYADKVDMLNTVFRNAETQNAIREEWGENILKRINLDIDYFSNRGVMAATVEQSIVTLFNRNFQFAQLAAKPQIGIKQLTSLFAYTDGVKTKDFIEGITALAANPQKAINTMRDSELWQQRGINLDRDYVEMMQDKSIFNFVGKNPRLANFLMAPIKYGDKGAIMLGGYAHYHAKRKSGATHEEAIRSFEIKTSRSQQSADPDQVSELQRQSSFIRIISQFMSSANALARAEYDAIVDGTRGRITKKELAKRIVVYHFIIPNLFQLVANGFSWEEEDQLRASVLGSFNGLFLVSDIVEFATSLALGQNPFDLEIRHPFSFFEDIALATKELADVGFDLGEFVEDEKALDRMLRGASSVFGGLPLRTIWNEMRGVATFAEGVADGDGDEVIEGGALMLGYSPYTVDKKILGE